MITTPVFALIDRDRRVSRTTEGFRTLSLDLETACEGSTDLESVLTGAARTATMVIGETRLEISAVTDGEGAPHALLRLPTEALGEPPTSADCNDWVGELRSSLDQSPALAWLKDAAGRHLYVNHRYLEALQVPEETLLGHTDDELAPGETVDGPRRSLAADGIEEPQELEYTVPAFAQRPAFAAVRFLVRDQAGEVLGVCGLAARLDQAQLARLEAERIVRERSTGMDPAAQDKLLREWGLVLSNDAQAPRDQEHVIDPVPTPEPRELVSPSAGATEETDLHRLPPAPEQPVDLVQRWDECVQRLQGEARHWQDEVSQSRSVVQEAQEQLSQALADRDAAQQEHDRLRGECEELERALSAERMRSEELVRTIEQLRLQISEVGRTIEHALPGDAATLTGEPGPSLPGEAMPSFPGEF